MLGWYEPGICMREGCGAPRQDESVLCQNHTAEVLRGEANAATTKDDPKMVEWFKPCSEAKTPEERTEAWMKLIEG